MSISIIPPLFLQKIIFPEPFNSDLSIKSKNKDEEILTNIEELMIKRKS
jgi:hypothetical protein